MNRTEEEMGGGHGGSIGKGTSGEAEDGRRDRIRLAMEEILRSIGENPDRQGLKKTPQRFADAMIDLTRGYGQSPAGVLGDAEFDENYHEIVVVRDIEIYSLCEHHMIPFFGKCHIAYLPTGRVVGLSKLARLADMYARRLQIQERLTTQIADALCNEINPAGVAVLMECSHLCMVMRGVQKSASTTVTSCMRGDFKKDSALRQQFMELLRR